MDLPIDPALLEGQVPSNSVVLQVPEIEISQWSNSRELNIASNVAPVCDAAGNVIES